ncbi:uncharacterized protein LOC142335433 [Convolutriloba macropyga]|uniref:uncharacterized protein LOC142335433 n=1 Tax=Convolutriloba macropyga TaxID=536237 RepID=UPI003F524EA3
MGDNKEAETDANAPPLPDKAQMECQQNGDFFPPPYPAGEKARLEVDPELYGYWSTDTQQEGEIEKKKNCDKSACEGEAVEDGGDDGIKRRRKKKNGFCIVTMVALVLLLVLAYQAGKRAGMWHRFKDDRHNGRGCGYKEGGRGDGDRHHHNHHHHHDDDDDRDGRGRGRGKSCNYRQRGQNEYNHGEVCVNNEPVEAVEWDRNVEGEQGSRWIQLVHDDGHGYLSGMQILDYFDENGDHVCMVMDGFFAELGQMLDHFDQFRYDIIEHFPFLNSTVEFVANQVRKITLLSEKLHGNERRDALQQTGGYCYEDSKMYRMFQDYVETHDHCMGGHQEEFMLPIDYHSSSSSSDSDMELGLYTFCIYELIIN